jgi:hypothetical protein
MHVKMILFAFLALLVGHVDSGNPYNVPPDILSKYRYSVNLKCPDLIAYPLGETKSGNWEYIASGRGSCSQGSAAMGNIDTSARTPGANYGPPGCWFDARESGGWGLAFRNSVTESTTSYHKCSQTFKCIW